jgi:hypothetical protein
MNAQPQLQTDDGSAVDQAVAREERLQAFGSTLAKTRDQWIRSRASSGWDKRVQQDSDQYHMRDDASRQAASMMDSVQQGFPVTTREARPHRSTVYIGITRQRSNAAEARFGDIMLPTDDENWGFQPTPDPECARALEEGGELIDPATGKPVLVDKDGNIVEEGVPGGRPLQKKEVAQAAQWIATRAAQAMATLVKDQLTECDYNSEQRRMIHDSVVMGVGVIKGPIVYKRTRKAWRERVDPNGTKVHVLEIVQENSPASYRVDPRFVWEDPACGDDVQNGQGVFELERLTVKRVRDLAKQPGYMLDQLRKVLREGPQPCTALSETMKTDDENKHLTPDNKLFEHWIFWGDLEREDLLAAGVKVSDDELASYSGCVEMINNTVVRAYLNPLDDGDIPYDFFPWEKIQGSVRGYGVPYLMRAEQSVMNAAWRQIMDNSALTAGPQIIVNRKAIRPMDNVWKLQSFKFWDLLDDSIDPSKAFHAVEFNSHQEELARVIELAMTLGDQSSGVPALVTGEKGSAPDTVGGMQMLMNSANVVLRRQVKQYDDCITKRHVRRYYYYNMQYSDEEEVKGDFQVDARGSSALLVRDIQNQAYLQLLAAGGNPTYSPFVDLKKLFTKALQAQHIDPKEIMNTDDVIEKNLQALSQRGDPRIQAAQINAQARVQEADAISKGRAAETEARATQEAEDRKLRVQELELKYKIAVLDASVRENITIEQVKAALATAAINDRTKKELAASEMIFKQTVSPDHQGI